MEFWLNRYQALLAGLAALLAAWITVNAIRHQTETARVDEAERALNEYAVAILEVMQKYEAVPVALSHETRQDAERRFQALNEATDAPTIRTAMIDSVIGGRSAHDYSVPGAIALRLLSQVNARSRTTLFELSMRPLYAALCDGINRRRRCFGTVRG